MIKLINISTDKWDLKKFEGDHNQIKKFLNKNELDGLEVIQSIERWNPEIIPKELIKGQHMNFWPIWLDFWNENYEEVLRQFGSRESYESYYGGKSKEAIVKKYRQELITAKEMKAEYVVFHVSHVELEHAYNWQFTYSDDEVIEAFIEALNLSLEGLELDFDILLENLWWPGFTMLDKKQGAKLIEGINYHKIGFVLDVGHLMITNSDLSSEKESVEYILKVVENFESSKIKIKGIHLNSSLSGEYINKIKQGKIHYDIKTPFNESLISSFQHISNIDRHEPFCDSSINKLIDLVDPDYLVLELMGESLEELQKKISLQNSVLKNK